MVGSLMAGCPRRSYSCVFSSRRRHTRCYRDWSSDVCSSDLHATGVEPSLLEELLGVRIPDRDGPVRGSSSDAPAVRTVGYRNTEKSCRRSWSERLRSEERRVGKVCKCGEWGGGLHGMHDLAI